METVTAAQILDGGGGGEYFMCQILSPLNGLFLARSDFDKARGGLFLSLHPMRAATVHASHDTDLSLAQYTEGGDMLR